MYSQKLAIFVHLGNSRLWNDINVYIKHALVNGDQYFDLYINFCPEIESTEQIALCKNLIESDYPGTHYFYNKNRGCDIGPYFKFLDYLRTKKIEYHSIIKLHSKTIKELRDKLIGSILHEGFNFDDIKKQGYTMKGWNTILYDYINIKYDLEYVRLLKINLITDWQKLIDKFPVFGSMTAIEKRIVCFNNNKAEKTKLYVPDIDTELYTQLFGDINKDHDFLIGVRKAEVINSIMTSINSDFKKCIFIPGTIFMHRHKIFIDAFKNIDYTKIYDQLEVGKPLNNFVQSRTHSWERMFSLIARYGCKS